MLEQVGDSLDVGYSRVFGGRQAYAFVGLNS
jgi:hypothetical protein